MLWLAGIKNRLKSVKRDDSIVRVSGEMLLFPLITCRSISGRKHLDN